MALPQVVADVAGWQRGQALEVQANVDRSMAVRMLTYTGLLYQRSPAGGEGEDDA